MKKLMSVCIIIALIIGLSACSEEGTGISATGEDISSAQEPVPTSDEVPDATENLPGIKNHTWDALDTEGKDLNDIEKELVWSWQHGDAAVGAGYAAVYLFMADKTYIYTANEVLGAERLRFHEGYWEISDDQLCIYTTRRAIIEGGVEADGSASMINVIEGGELVFYSVDPPDTIIVPIDELFSQSTEEQKIILIEDEPYYRFNISPYYLDNYEDYRNGDLSH